MIRSVLARKHFISSDTPRSIPEGNKGKSSRQAGMWRQELKQRQWGMLFNGLLLMGCSMYFFFNTTQDHLPRDGSAHSEMSLPHINHRSRKHPIDLSTCNLMEAFSQLMFHLPDDFGS